MPWRTGSPPEARKTAGRPVFPGGKDPSEVRPTRPSDALQAPLVGGRRRPGGRRGRFNADTTYALARRTNRPADVRFPSTVFGSPVWEGPYPPVLVHEAGLSDARSALRRSQVPRRPSPARAVRKHRSTRHGPRTRAAAASSGRAAYRRRFVVPRSTPGRSLARTEGTRDDGREVPGRGSPGEPRATFVRQDEERSRTLPRSKALKAAGPAGRDAPRNVKRATVDGDVGTAVAVGKALEGQAPAGKHAAPIRHRASRRNPVNPRVGSRMQ